LLLSPFAGSLSSKQAHDADQRDWLAGSFLAVWANAFHLTRGDGELMKQLQNGETI
jgi:hypothetical protein